MAAAVETATQRRDLRNCQSALLAKLERWGWPLPIQLWA